jgi:hypothetical protein
MKTHESVPARSNMDGIGGGADKVARSWGISIDFDVLEDFKSSWHLLFLPSTPPLELAEGGDWLESVLSMESSTSSPLCLLMALGTSLSDRTDSSGSGLSLGSGGSKEKRRMTLAEQ